jgi:hypothetical protein
MSCFAVRRFYNSACSPQASSGRKVASTSCLWATLAKYWHLSLVLGAGESLKRCVGVQLECSLSPLYEKQWTIEAAISFMRKAGFAPWAMKRGFIKDRREFELDMIFFREGAIVGL